MKKLIVANWKMNMDSKALASWIQKWGQHNTLNTLQVENVEIVIAPTFFHLGMNLVQDLKPVTLSAQNVSEFDKGAHTGETGAFQLKDVCRYCIVGHSERKESTTTVKNKANKCIENGITPIVCLTNHKQATVYKDIERAIFAWEDPANISKNGKYVPKDAQDIEHGVKELTKALEVETILYGGSVNLENIEDLVRVEGIRGALVGNASLDADTFAKMCAIL